MINRQWTLGAFSAWFGVAMVLMGLTSQPFKQDQLRYPRVRQAYENKADALKRDFASRNWEWPPQEMLIRVLKREFHLEVWIRSANMDRFHRFKTCDVCAMSGGSGPKRRQGDLQVPEGLYHVDRFNPASRFHLSLGINYPNRSDRILGDPKLPGGDIFIHGNCVSIGCVAIQDDPMEEVYVLAVETRNQGQRKVPVHLFPEAMDEQGLRHLRAQAQWPENQTLWQELARAYQLVNEQGRVPEFSIDGQGTYHVSLE